MRERSVGMFRGDGGVARFSMLNGFGQMRNRFLPMRAFASPLSKVQRLLRMCHERLSMILFAMVHGLLRLHDGVHDVSGGGRLGIQHGHTHERSKCKQNEGTTVEFASHVCLPFLVRIHCRKRL